MARPSVEVQRREQILRATCAVVAEVGFRSLRVTDVARRAGCSSGTVHYYYGTKRDLIQAAFEHNFRDSLDRRRQLFASEADAEQRLRELVRSYLPGTPETTQAWRVWAELWVEALHDPDLRELNDTVYGSWRTRVAGLIAEGQAQGTMREGDPTLLANAVIGLIDGLSIQVLLGSRDLGQAQVDAVCELLMDTLLRPVG